MLMKERNAVVTGAAGGIGLAIAERLAAQGASVVLVDVDRERGEAAAARLRERAYRASFVQCDLGRVDSIDAMADAAIGALGRVDVLVNNAGVTKSIALLDITPDEWDWVQSVNTRGLFFCLQRFARHMKEIGGGRIVNISSVAGKGLKGASNASYVASKAAVIAIARQAADELGPFNITVNTVCPGVTRTEMLDQIEASVPGFIAQRAKTSSLGRVSDPEDIADAVVFLSSAMSRSVTGQSLNVDCGQVWD